MKCPACGIPIKSVHMDFWPRCEAHPCGDYLDIHQVQAMLQAEGVRSVMLHAHSRAYFTWEETNG